MSLYDVFGECELTKSGHLTRRGFGNPGRTTWSDVVAADFAHACDTCPRKFPGIGSLTAHSRRCKHAKHIYTECQLAFPPVGALRVHAQRCRQATLQEPGRRPQQYHEVLNVSDALGPPSWRFYRVRWSRETNASSMGRRNQCPLGSNGRWHSVLFLDSSLAPSRKKL